MRSKIVEEQLKKISVAKLDNFESGTNTYHIKKYTRARLELGKAYIIKVPIYMVNNNTSVMAVNWNHGSSPKYEYLKICVTKIIGRVVYCDTIGFNMQTGQDINNIWSGYLNTEDIELIQKL